jgi:hypothetical protein
MSTRTAVGGVVQYSLRTNVFGDYLPVIPAESFVAFGSVLFRMDLDVALSLNGKPVVGQTIPFVVSGVHSSARLLQPTDHEGRSILRMETRYSGTNTVRPTAMEFAHSTFDVTIDEAWYEAPFLITAYNCCDEDEFSGPLVEGCGVGMHKRDFLYGGNGVIMEGSGKGSDGRFIQISNPEVMRWNPGYKGVCNPADAVFEYVEAPEGAFSSVVEGRSIAIDPAILPPLHRVNIIGPRVLGIRRGDDTGGAIRGFHFDHFVGAGCEAMRLWNEAGGNIEQARVKYLGVLEAEYDV